MSDIAIRNRLVSSGWCESWVDITSGPLWTESFQAVVANTAAHMRRALVPRPSVAFFPGPVISLESQRRTGFHAAFPQQACRVGGADQMDSKFALAGAACHPIFANWRPDLQAGPETCWVESWAFRREAYGGVFRLNAFRQGEGVVVGVPSDVEALLAQWRDEWLEALSALGLSTITARGA